MKKNIAHVSVLGYFYPPFVFLMKWSVFCDTNCVGFCWEYVCSAHLSQKNKLKAWILKMNNFTFNLIHISGHVGNVLRVAEIERPGIVFLQHRRSAMSSSAWKQLSICDLNGCWSTMSGDGFKVKDKTAQNILRNIHEYT